MVQRLSGQLDLSHFHTIPLWFSPKKEKVSFDGVVIFRFPKTYCSLCGLSVKHTVNKMCTKHNRQGSCEKLLTDTAHPQHLLQSFNHHHLSARPWQTTTSSQMDSPWDGTGSSILLAWQRLLHWFQFGTTHLDWPQMKHKSMKMSSTQCTWQLSLVLLMIPYLLTSVFVHEIEWPTLLDVMAVESLKEEKTVGHQCLYLAAWLEREAKMKVC